MFRSCNVHRAGAARAADLRVQLVPSQIWLSPWTLYPFRHRNSSKRHDLMEEIRADELPAIQESYVLL